MNITFRAPLAGGATGRICLGFEVTGIVRTVQGIRGDVRVYDADYPSGQSIDVSVAMHTGEFEGLTFEEIEAKATHGAAVMIKGSAERLRWAEVIHA